MNNQEKNGTKGLILLLLAMVLFAVYQVVILPIMNQRNQSAVELPKTDEITVEEIGEELYPKVSLTIEEEAGITSSDEIALNEKLSIYKMSDKLKINIGIKNIKEENIVSDGGYSPKEAANNMDGNFYYSGKYISPKTVQENIDSILGPIPIQHQTITLKNNKYVYNKVKNRYEIWVNRKKQDIKEEKITYKEIVAKEEELLIYEYVAYTDFSNSDNAKTRTVHSKMIEKVITEENVRENLNYMDKYKYTFKKNKDGNYYLVSIEYIVE